MDAADNEDGVALHPSAGSRAAGSVPASPGVEIEAKFLVEDPADVPDVIDIVRPHQVQSVRAVDIVDRYWDTPDWRLFEAGWAYRWREASGKRKLTLKSIGLSGDVTHTRHEVEQAVAAFPDNGRMVPHGPVAQQLNSVRPGDLRELFRVHNTRRLFTIRTDQGALIEVALDQATITAAGQVGKLAPGRMAFVEIEMELKEGPAESLRHLAQAVAQRPGLLASRLSKFERGLQTIGLWPGRPGGTAEALVDSPFIRELRGQALGPAAPAIRLVYRCLLERFETMLAEEPKAWEGLDVEGVHQMRVATRRLRAAFRAFKEFLPQRARVSFDREFKWVAGILGLVRDLDVYQQNLQHYAEEIPPEDAERLGDYRRHLAGQWRRARTRLVACLTSRRYARLKARFGRLLERGPSRAAVRALGALTIGGAARRLIARRYKRVCRAGRAIGPGCPDAALHKLRIQCKRLRYLFEFFRPIYGGALAPYIKRLKRLQDCLGDFQDAVVATQQLRQYADTVPMRARNRQQLIVLGQLISGQRRQAAAKRADFAKAWKRFDRKGGRRKISVALGGMEALGDRL